MKRNILPLLALAAASTVLAQTPLDPGTSATLRSRRAGYSVGTRPDGKGHLMRKSQSERQSVQTVGAFITLNAGYSASDLEAEGLSLHATRGDFYLARIPLDEVERIASHPAVATLRLERTVTGKMDRVRASIGADALQAGDVLDYKYTGKGVLCAAVDGGYDPNHLNFRNPDGSSRILNFTYFRPTEYGDPATENYGPDYMPQIDTENSTTFHGTHTLGIMAGGYRGKVNAAQMAESPSGQSGPSVEISEIDNPYYGIAPEADIAVASGVSTDYYIALGIDEILNFASERQAQLGHPYPVVINLSMGTNLGPHDGTGLLATYLDEVSEKGHTSNTVCVAAGNEGDLNIAAHKVFAEGDDTLLVGMESFDTDPVEYPNVVNGPVYIYSDTEEPFEVQALIYNKERGTVVFRAVAKADGSGEDLYYVSSPEFSSYDSDVVSPQLAQYFNGYIGVSGMLDSLESGRYFGVVDAMLWETEANRSNYVLVIQVKGTAGQRVDMFADGQFFQFGDHGLSALGVTPGTCDGSICDTATGHNTIVVGSYNTRDAWASLDGELYSYDLFHGEEVSSFSSWGTLVDGRRLPTVCAPGATVISSTNEYYLQDNSIGIDNLQATAEADGRRYSWHQCVGTSMATPVVSGTVALWKEADPTLSYSDIRDIIETTARKDADVMSDPSLSVKWGAGKLDARAGLVEVLRRMGIDSVADIEAEPGRSFMVTSVAGGYHVVAAGASRLEVRVYDITGAEAASMSSDSNEGTVAVSSLGKGVYLLNINGVHTEKIVVK